MVPEYVKEAQANADLETICLMEAEGWLLP
jgi:hypothetical protein